MASQVMASAAQMKDAKRAIGRSMGDSLLECRQSQGDGCVPESARTKDRQ
ncbi:hypothetical protein M770_31695 (plasmid) [Pseudomonas aeruginosa VRFPA03]|nr:hypothetical protein M770_31695 [Pseudomonas aeruginosa VRFPA03]